jgi:hypothetical protein
MPPPTYGSNPERSRGAPSDPGAFCRAWQPIMNGTGKTRPLSTQW